MLELNGLLEQIAQLGLESRDLDAYAAQLAVLRARVAARPSPGADDRLLDTRAANADACLQRAPPSIADGLAQAHTAHTLAQLALNKLGGAVEAQLKLCRAKSTPAPVDPDAAVAAKHCSYPGSEPYWDSTELRAMCRCPSGRRWNDDRSACVTDPDWRAQVRAQDCSDEPNAQAY